MATITYRNDGTTFFIDVTDAPPVTELYLQLNSNPVPPNEDTTGVGIALHNTSDDLGSLTFHAPTDFVLPNLPRTVVSSVAFDATTIEQATLSEQF